MANVKLVTVTSQIDADILAEMLSNEGIYSLQMASEVGVYMKQTTGFEMNPVDIYVTRHDYDMAKEIADMYVEKAACNVEQAKADEETVIHLEEIEETAQRTKIKNGILHKYASGAGAFSTVGAAGVMIINQI